MTRSWVRRCTGNGLVLATILVVGGCGDSIATLDKLAAAGAIHRTAPATAHLEIEIAAPPERVWKLLIDASSWPKWAPQIESVDTSGSLAMGESFTWKTGGSNIHSQVQLFEPNHRLSWTGTAFTAKAVHVWELARLPNGGTNVTVNESMDGPLMKTIFPSAKLAEADKDWLASLKQAAERNP